MIEQQVGNDASDNSRNKSTAETVKDAASEAYEKASEFARDTGAKAKHVVAETTSSVSGEVRGIVNRQLHESWSVAGQVATSFKLAADDLDEKSPVAAGLVRNLADKVQGYAEGFQDQTVEQVMRSASDFARRQPAVAFGIGAFAGFLLFRTFKSGQGVAPPASRAAERSRMTGEVDSYHG